MIHPEAIRLSKHAAKRLQEREISEMQIAVAIDYGRLVYGNGVEYRFLGKRDIPSWLHPRYAERFEGTVVILGQNGIVVTAYRNHEGINKIKKLEKTSRDPRCNIRGGR